MLTHPIYVEIPAVDLKRAMQFYGTVLNKELEEVDEKVRRYAVIASTADGGVGATINQTSNFPPSPIGPLVYFQAEGTIDTVLEEIKSAGGEVVIPKTNLVESDASAGFYATFKDTEGNVLGIFATS